MYFYLSKTLGDLAVPSNFILLVFACGLLLLWRTRFVRLGRRLTALGAILFLIVGYTPLGTALLLPLEDRFPAPNLSNPPPTGVIVLGGVVNTYISARRNEIAVDSAANRLIAAVGLQRRYPNLRIVFSGGNSNLVFKGRAESGFAAQFMKNLGVPDANITVDDAARNTMENAVNARKIADPKPGERWLLITSALHMPRAMGLFYMADFPVEAYPVNYNTGGWRDLLALPSLSPLGGLYRVDSAAHEWEGLLFDWATGRSAALFPGPTAGSQFSH